MENSNFIENDNPETTLPPNEDSGIIKDDIQENINPPVKKNQSQLLILILAIIVAFVAGWFAKSSGIFNSIVPKHVKMSSFEDSFSYLVGEDIGQNVRKEVADWKNDDIKVNDDLLIKAFRTQMKDTNVVFNEQSKRMLSMQFQMLRREKYTQKMKLEAEPNKKAGAEWLKKNKNQPGIKELPDGLQYRIITEGTGKTPKDTDWITVHYIGKMINGDEFENSYDMKKPGVFRLNKMIPGWIEGIPLIKEGGKIELFLPSDLAYGDFTPGDPIKPGSTLIFTVELIKVGEAPKNPPPGQEQ